MNASCGARRALFLLGLAMLMAGWAGPGRAERIAVDAGQRIPFPSGKETIWGQLFAPGGAGPFPALVLLHDTRGLHSTQRQWGERFAGWGYVALMVDSFGPRGIHSGKALGGFKQADDAYAAPAYLAGLENVVPGRVGIIGWSMGGRTTLTVPSAATEAPAAPRYFKTVGRFRVGIAYYSQCLDTLYYTRLLILVGAQDGLSYEGCRRIAETGRAGGDPIQLVVYPGATHSFDYGASGTFAFGKIAPDPEAERNAIERVKAFLARNL